MVKAYAYIRSLGAEGLRRSSEIAVLNANYIRSA
jgi:glycine dehydrogenase subunit 2